MLALDSIILILLTAAALIHELSASLLPPVLLLFFLYAKKTHRIFHFLAVSDILILVYAAMMTGFKFQDPNIIAESWSGIYGNPASFRSNPGLLNVVNAERATAIAKVSISQIPNVPIKIIPHMLIAIAVPFIVLLMSGITIFHSASSKIRKMKCALLILCIVPLGLCLTAVDYGRWFSLCATSLVTYALLLAHAGGRMTRNSCLSEKARMIKRTAAQCTVIALAVVLLNYQLYHRGYFFYKPEQSIFNGSKQMIANLSALPKLMTQLITRDMVIKPLNR